MRFQFLGCVPTLLVLSLAIPGATSVTLVAGAAGCSLPSDVAPGAGNGNGNGNGNAGNGNGNFNTGNGNGNGNAGDGQGNFESGDGQGNFDAARPSGTGDLACLMRQIERLAGVSPQS